MTARTIIECSLPAGTKREAFADFPGSDDAVASGCTCPVTQPFPRALRFASDCPLHELERVAS